MASSWHAGSAGRQVGIARPCVELAVAVAEHPGAPGNRSKDSHMAPLCTARGVAMRSKWAAHVAMGGVPRKALAPKDTCMASCSRPAKTVRCIHRYAVDKPTQQGHLTVQTHPRVLGLVWRWPLNTRPPCAAWWCPKSGPHNPQDLWPPLAATFSRRMGAPQPL